MILVDAGQRDARSFDARLVFAMGLHHAGFSVALDDRTVPDTLHRTQKYEAQALLTPSDDLHPTGVVLIGAETPSDATLSTLRRYGLGADQPVVALGRFQTHQARIGAQAKIAYATGHEPHMIDLADVQRAPFEGAGLSPLLCTGTDPRPIQKHPRVLMVLPGDPAADPGISHALSLLSAARTYDATLITSAKGKQALAPLKPTSQTVFAYSEIAPLTLAGLTDIVVVMGETSAGTRINQTCAEVLGAGGIVIDGTATGCLVASGGPIVRGPTDIVGMTVFLEHDILPRLDALHAEVSRSDWVRANRLTALTDRFPAPLRATPARGMHIEQPKTVFIPTNGIGLGHAQRCSQIAREIPEPGAVRFAAFPSCIEMVESHGFGCTPLVQKSTVHADPYANDIVNYRRLSRHLSPGDRLVFDGVYIFDSIYRTILERDLDAVWIRRGLWRAHQTNTAALEREHCFSRVVVPHEAFDELNQHYSFGTHIHPVGPIVQHDDGDADAVAQSRAAIARQLGHPFKKLVVSMLGGGVAADRGSQLQTICAALERRPDTLHLIVVWPNAKIAPELMLWSNTRVVHSLSALRLARAADFVISAVGYNSFHEILYHQIPSILIPQMAPYMDDQERRARAAVDRDLADIILPEELLQLDRLIGRFLETDRAETLRTALEHVALPPPGNARAAQIIQGGCNGS